MSRLICRINGIIIPVMGNLGIPLACVSRVFFFILFLSLCKCFVLQFHRPWVPISRSQINLYVIHVDT